VTIDQRQELIRKLLNKEYRDSFVSAYIDQGIPFQIRALRLQRKWKQEDLAQRAKMKQARISAIENPNYQSFSLRTLKQLASAFDIGLVVRFVPFSDLVKWDLNLSAESLEVISFDEDAYFKETEELYDLPMKTDSRFFPQKDNVIYPHFWAAEESPINQAFQSKQQDIQTSIYRLSAGGKP